MSREHANKTAPGSVAKDLPATKAFAVETFRGPLIIVTAMLASSLAMLGFAVFLGS